MSTKPLAAHNVQKGKCIMLKGHPCSISDVFISKTGKHGHVKVNITGVCILTGVKLNEVHPGHFIMQEVVVVQKDCILSNVNMEENNIEVLCGNINKDLDLTYTSEEQKQQLSMRWKEVSTSQTEGVLVTVITTPIGKGDDLVQQSAVIKVQKTTKLE